MVNMELSQRNRFIIAAYNKGYRVIDGNVYSPFSDRFLKLRQNQDGYFCFTVFHEKQRKTIMVHRLVAYQKYKDKIFEDGIQVRHLDGNEQNNLDYNIAIGTARDNHLDKPKETRVKCAVNAASKLRRFSDLEMLTIKNRYKELKSYKKTMQEFDISSKGTLHYILNADYKTTC